MTANADRFNGRVADYERYRMRYPAAVLAVLREHCGLRAEDVIADVGAGTGMLAEIFLEAGHRVIAVEPNAEMRQACARLGEAFPGLQVLPAAAEATGLEDASVDMVVVGRAFHWFDRERALAEFRRVLKPGGWVVLAGNRRAMDGSAPTVEYEKILLRHGTDYAAVRENYTEYGKLNAYGWKSFQVTMPGEQRLTLEALLGQTQSLSIAPHPRQPGFEGMQLALRELFTRFAVGGMLTLGTVCEVAGWQPVA